MDNPFHFGKVVSGDHFADRQNELHTLVADIRNGQNVVVISPRRYGKTSLVLQARENLLRQDFLVAYLDLFRMSSRAAFADHLAHTMFRDLVSPLERMKQRAIDVFQKLPVRPKITLNQDGSPSFEFTHGERERDLDLAIETLLGLPGQIARERKRRVAVVMDEFQEVMTIDPNLPLLMRSIFQHQSDVAHVFLGSRRHLMERVFTKRNEPMHRMAKVLPLGQIAADDFVAFIQGRFLATGRQIANEAAGRILEITEGHPHDTQELCYFLWSLADDRSVPATPALVDEALSMAIDTERAHYTELWDGLTARRRLLMAALAMSSAKAVLAEQYRSEHGLGAASSVQTALAYLVDHEFVEKAADGSYRVPDPFLRQWILDTMKPAS